MISRNKVANKNFKKVLNIIFDIKIAPGIHLSHHLKFFLDLCSQNLFYYPLLIDKAVKHMTLSDDPNQSLIKQIETCFLIFML